MEIMIETTQSIINHKGENTVPLLVAAGGGRCRSAIFGTYDYTASCNITAAHQSHTHPACDFARHVLQVSLAGTGITISDGATTSMPIGPHKAPRTRLSPQQMDENRAVVHGAWKLHYDNIMHSMRHAYYQGWDLNPGAVAGALCGGRYLLPQRSAGCLGAAERLPEQGGPGDAGGQHLRRCGDRSGPAEFLPARNGLRRDHRAGSSGHGITLDELRSRSFVRIVNNRAKK
jgi:hypothetical protein